jgi:hypothetical protein
MYNTDMPTRAELPTTGQLLRSTAIAIAAAAALLVTVVLPAEYAIDPTGIGKVLGLTEMGEIKQQLAEEAAMDAAATTEPEALSATPIAPVVSKVDEQAAPAPAPVAEQPIWTDTVTLTLAPGEAAEVKLVMKAGDTATYAWRVDNGHLNSDLHGDGTRGQSTSYRKGRAETEDTGDFTAAFDGSHGWFWRNRSDVSVELTLDTKGAYSEVKRVL